jgi:DNA-binding NarL/FixJ family response regulator
MIKVILADDHRLFQQSLSQLLNRFRRIKILAEFDNGLDALTFLEESSEIPDILVTDIRMPEMDGFELLTQVRKKYPNIRVIMLSMFDSIQNIRESLDGGASAYLDKTVEPEELVKAIIQVHDYGFYETPKTQNAMESGIKQEVVDTVNLRLTPAEERVIILICKELSNAEMAVRVDKSVRTVEALRQSIMEKSGAKNVAGVVKFAIKSGLYNPHKED